MFIFDIFSGRLMLVRVRCLCVLTGHCVVCIIFRSAFAGQGQRPLCLDWLLCSLFYFQVGFCRSGTDVFVFKSYICTDGCI